MGNEMTVYDVNQDITLYRPPETVLAEAHKAAKSLSDVVSKKKNPVVFKGEQYLEFEDWQTVGRFYGVTAKVESTKFIEYGAVQGFEARAIAIRADGMEISAAEAMCLNDEPNWKSKPLFQLRSMAQTRSCAKALRNVLAWVVVLAGYRATPAEEIKDMIPGNGGQHPPLQEPGKKKADPPAEKKADVPLEVITAVLDVECKEGIGKPKAGEKEGKPYVIFGIKGEGDTMFKTFSYTFADLARGAMSDGSKVKIAFKAGQYGNTITALELVESRDPGAEG